MTEVGEPLTIESAEMSDSLRFAALVAYTAEVLRGDAVVTERGVTLDILLAEATYLADRGVDGAAEMVELISTALYAEDPAPSPSIED